jgi:hypothetical protein
MGKIELGALNTASTTRWSKPSLERTVNGTRNGSRNRDLNW